MGFCNCSMFLCVTLCPFWVCNRLDGEEGACCFAQFVFIASHGCCAALPRGAKGLSEVSDCDISLSHSLFLGIQYLAYTPAAKA